MKLIERLKKMTRKQKIIGSITSSILLMGIIVTSVIVWSGDSKQLVDTDTGIINDIEEGIEKETIDGSKTVDEDMVIHVESIENTDYGMVTKPKFKISSNVPMKETTIKKQLRLSPSKNYSLEKVNDQAYIVSVNEAYNHNEIVKVTYGKEKATMGWAFQTEKAFIVASTHPTDQGEYVPIDSGIECFFTKELNGKKIDDYFLIQPATDGKFQYHDNKVIFVPDTHLERDIDYTITIKKGYNNGKETLEKDHVFSFHTNNYASKSTGIYLRGSAGYMTFLQPDSPQILACYFGEKAGETVDINVYKFANETDFIEGYEQHDRMSIKEYVATLEATQKHTYQTDIQNHDHEHYLELQQMDEGYYFLTAQYENSIDRMFIQVSPFNGYTAVDKDKFLVWMVDGSHSSPVTDAKVIVNGEHLGETNKDGLAVIHKSLDQEKTSWITLQANNQLPLYLPTRINKYVQNSSSLYWSYLYFDRGLYLPTDDIHVFGFAQKRDGKNIGTVKVKLQNSDGRLIEEKEVKLSDIGTYETHFKLDNYLKDYVRVAVLIDNQEVNLRYLNIARFEKPVIHLNTTLDKGFIMMGDTVTYAADATFYEGTPAAYAGISVNSSYGSLGKVENNQTCDIQGHKELTLSPSVTTSDWRPKYMGIRTQYTGLEKVYVDDYEGLLIFPRDIMVEGETKKIYDEAVEVRVDVHQINLGGFQGETHQYDDYRGDEVSEQPINIEIIETYYEKIHRGKRYDHIKKVSYDVYDSKKHQNTVKTVIGTTDESGSFIFNFNKMIPERGYTIIITTQDSKGRNIQEKLYYSRALNQYYDNQTRRYTGRLDKNRYKKNEQIQMDILQGYEPIAVREHDQVLFFLCQDGIMDYGITDKTSITMPYVNKYIPNAKIHTVYFDGKALHQIGYPQDVYYDYEDEVLEIQIATDKKDYKPGDEARVTVKVTDKNQKPVEADVNINVVDEAFLTLCEDNSDVISSLYAHAYGSGLVGEYLAAYNIYYGDGGPECGGEGEADFIRSDFKNTADFTTITTNELGIGETTFTIPDNLTSWRITCTAMDETLRAGKEKYNINAKLPFFISSIVYDHYLEGDVIEATIKTAGAQLSREDDVAFTAIIKQENGESSKVVTMGKGYQYVNLPIGNLPIGKHKITIIGECGDYKDGESFDIEVVKTFHYFDMIMEDDLAEDLQIVSNGQDVQLRFFNEEAFKHYKGLMQIYNKQNINRNDMKVVAYTAGKVLNKRYHCNLNLDDEPLKQIMRYSGLYRGFDYSEDSAVTTAELIAIGYVVDKERQAKGLLEVAMKEEATSEENAAALWGLAMLGEPVLFNLEEMYDMYHDQPVTLDTMYLMQASLDIGQLEKGKELYEKAKVYLKKDDDKQHIEGLKYNVKFTAMMMMAALKLDRMEEAKAMYNYLKGVQDVYYPTVAERLYYLQHTTPEETTASFTYAILDQEETVTIDYNDYFELNLTPEDVAKIKFSEIQGKINVEKSFTGQVKDIKKTDRYNITRWYTKETSGDRFQQGELIQVHLKVDVYDHDLSYFNIEDILPAGLTYLGRSDIMPSYRSYVWTDNEVHRTHIHAYSHRKELDDTKPHSFEITYLAKAVLAGEYIAEPVVIRDTNYNEASYSDTNKIKIY